ncbi:hypothetical protein Q2T46_10635 [Thermoanaerobacterium sp. CMT5567-10]|uniref:hypothetical protein n=1 Tax=Thermoanaerobacterium sp. CMT5567-10 TaxID=3061989 RepID=UPI00287F5E12|nr:hypothetical protein [Thermoanaerobacterium sp. CMT5567-10]WKV07999.2 hypothetical protein Q2T46_10635 [Thermoanaerobacterium sp. CMT5567-10]
MDFLYPKGHICQNASYISCFAKFVNVYVICPKRHYNNLPKEVKVIEKDSLKIKDGRLFSRLSTLKIMLISAIIARKLKPDYVFISSYETIMFSIGRLFFRRRERLSYYITSI